MNLRLLFFGSGLLSNLATFCGGPILCLFEGLFMRGGLNLEY